jgi:uncharacterized protein (UPF0248 family)
LDLVKQKMVIAKKFQIDDRVWDGEEEIVLDDEEEDDSEPILRFVSKPAVNDLKYGKLRPSQDILNRLFWDSRFCPDDYVVGYEDRFKGIKEMNLTSWKKELSDEEFIPMHWVVYFREKGVEGSIVWDRRTRVDLIFGSGQQN